jgi:hypothetical protein
MPQRTRDYHSWRLEKLVDPEIAEGYLNDALTDSPEMFLKALLNVMQITLQRDTAIEIKIFTERGRPRLRGRSFANEIVIKLSKRHHFDRNIKNH